MKQKPSPGTHAGHVLAVVRDGKLMQGALDAKPVPWWSFTKTVLAAAALALVRDRVLSLDAAQPGKTYTLRQLLQHTAGIPNYTELDTYQPAVLRTDAPWSEEEMLARVNADRLLFEPGTGWRYSNTGYFLVRRIIENATALEIDAAIGALVLTPLAIRGVTLARTVADMAATEWGNEARYDPRWVYHGHLLGPPAAAALLLDRLLNSSLLPQDLAIDMRKPYPLGHELPGRPCMDFGYGLGLMLAQHGPAGRSCGHTGHDPASVAAVYHFPDGIAAHTIAAFAPTGDQATVEWIVHNTAAEMASVR